MPRHCLSAMRRESVPLEPATFFSAPVPPGALIFPAFRFGHPLRIEPSAPAGAVLELLQRCVNFLAHREAALAYLSRFAGQLPTFDLSFTQGPPAAALVAETLGARFGA